MTDLDPDAAESAPPAVLEDADGWHARLRLRLADADGRTSIIERSQVGSLSIDGPRYAEPDGACEVAITYPRNGIGSGERFRLKVDMTDAGEALLTTSGPLRLHPGDGLLSLVDRQLTVSSSSSLEWLPHELIVGAGADAQLNTRVILEEQARFLGWEVVSLARQTGDPTGVDGQLRQRLEIRRAGEPLVDEAVVVEAGSISAAGREIGGSALGTLVAVVPDEVAELVAGSLSSLVDVAFPGAVWQVPGALIVRIAAADAEHVLDELAGAWRVVRPLVIGREAGALSRATA